MVQDNHVVESRPRLGRGLAALLQELTVEAAQTKSFKSPTQIPIELLRSSKCNPRRTFNMVELESLANSIKERGILQPILVRPTSVDAPTYEIVAGERRWRAAQISGLTTVPVIVLNLTDRESLEIALVENIQREDLNALEEAEGYTLLISHHGYTQDEVGNIVGKSRSHIANTMRLLALPEYTKTLVTTGIISAGHARALLTLDNPDKIADKIILERLNVREVERLASREKPSQRPNNKGAVASADVERYEQILRDSLGSKVNLRIQGTKGQLSIFFQSLDHLDDICRKLTFSNSDE